MSELHNDINLTNRRRELRQNSTPAEKIMWQCLRGNRFGFKFRRQHSLGSFIVDFYCPEKRLIIEIDGGVHLENQELDQARDEYFRQLNYKVIRFWNEEVHKNLDKVLEKIKSQLC
jgi:very-short-patch-repair endonuclease